MEIVPIFATRLYAVRYKPEDLDEWEKLFDDWNDVELLEEFFEGNKNDLRSGFFDPIPSIEEAIKLTREEAVKLEGLLKKHAKNPDYALDTIFKPLTENEDTVLPRQKAYGTRNKSWLRIYAIKIEDAYIVTGGTIKLTKSMGERDHTLKEKNKMERCLSFFKEHGIDSFEGFKELDL